MGEMVYKENCTKYLQDNKKILYCMVQRYDLSGRKQEYPLAVDMNIWRLPARLPMWDRIQNFILRR
jgi:hypothetical protein